SPLSTSAASGSRSLPPEVPAEVLVADTQVQGEEADTDHHHQRPEHVEERDAVGLGLPDDNGRTASRRQENGRNDHSSPASAHLHALPRRTSNRLHRSRICSRRAVPLSRKNHPAGGRAISAASLRRIIARESSNASAFAGMQRACRGSTASPCQGGGPSTA